MSLLEAGTYRIILILSAVGLLIWQIQIVNSKGRPVQRSLDSEELSFTMNTGKKVVLPDNSERYSVVIFWKVDSERSMLLVDEAVRLLKEHTYDTLAAVYLLNLNDSLREIRSKVDLDDTDIPFAYDPEGALLERYQIRSLPYTIVLSGTGDIMDSFEGYQEGRLAESLERVIRLKQMLGKSGTFRL